jgi:hypothetical protein
MRFFIFTAVRIYDVVLWFMTSCDLVDVTEVSEDHIVSYVRTKASQIWVFGKGGSRQRIFWASGFSFPADTTLFSGNNDEYLYRKLDVVI